MESYSKNDVVTGVVTGVENYGIFVSFGDYTGLIHISEISSNFVSDTNAYAKIGDKITAKIIEIDEKNKQFKLSLKDFTSSEKNNKKEKIVETKNGFTPLADNLDKWVNDKIKEINQKS